MPNTIPQRQNEDRFMDMHAAIAWFYGCAKTCMGLQMLLTICGAGVLTWFASKHPELKHWTAFAAVTITLIDTLLLERIQSFYKKKGADMKELLDTSLLDLPWNGWRCGTAYSKADYALANRRFRSRRGKALKRLRDWYPKAIDAIPLPLARLICQRTNCWYDSSLRTKYGLVLYSVFGIIALGVVVCSITRELTVAEMIMQLYVPLSPAFMWLLREAPKHWKAADLHDRTRKAIDAEWQRLLGMNGDAHDAQRVSRSIQDLLYDGRLKNPLVFDSFYLLVRKDHEVGMDEEAQEKVNEAKVNLR